MGSAWTLQPSGVTIFGISILGLSNINNEQTFGQRCWPELGTCYCDNVVYPMTKPDTSYRVLFRSRQTHKQTHTLTDPNPRLATIIWLILESIENTVFVKRNAHLIPIFCGPLALGEGGQKFT